MKIRFLHTLPLLLLTLFLVLLTACAAGPNPDVGTQAGDGTVAGFWMGLWHGFIFPFTFLISLINHDVGVYEVHNNGGWYNFGYLIGLSIIFGGGGRSAARRRRVVIVQE